MQSIKNRLFIVFSVLIIAQVSLEAQTELNRSLPIDFHSSYTTDGFVNLSGGSRVGSAFVGLLAFQASTETENLGLWKNGHVKTTVMNTHGGRPSATFSGDFQGLCNIESDERTFLYELWYRQEFSGSRFTVGVLDIGAEFITSSTASSFLNSSFGIHSTLSENFTSPVFPHTAAGMTGNFQILKNCALAVGIFDGHPDDYSAHSHNLHWTINSDDGALYLAEIQLSDSTFTQFSTNLKLGFYEHAHGDDYELYGDAQTISRGIYLTLDKHFTSSFLGGGLDAFLLGSYSLQTAGINYWFFGTGVKKNSVFTSNKDAAGIAIAIAGLQRTSHGNETVIELFYEYRCLESFSIKPDIQYIIHPSGNSNLMNNALAATIRCMVAL